MQSVFDELSVTPDCVNNDFDLNKLANANENSGVPNTT